jgi:acyl-coenzyme A synthetase/AMP-(fatty) acid ligase
VKVAGYRVELEEVEATLRRRPAVIDCVAALVELRGASALAVAFVCRTTIAERTLRLFLAELLPTYMRPAKLIEVPRLPLLASGKVDRKEAASLLKRELRP